MAAPNLTSLHWQRKNWSRSIDKNKKFDSLAEELFFWRSFPSFRMGCNSISPPQVRISPQDAIPAKGLESQVSMGTRPQRSCGLSFSEDCCRCSATIPRTENELTDLLLRSGTAFEVIRLEEKKRAIYRSRFRTWGGESRRNKTEKPNVK